MPGFATQLTCLTLGLALCVPPAVAVRDTRATARLVRTSTPERPHLGLPAPHVLPRAPVLHVFFAPGASPTPLRLRVPVVQRAVVHDAAPQNAWKARAHPSQAPPVES